jgi:M6 family metalloprotease-like protein
MKTNIYFFGLAAILMSVLLFSTFQLHAVTASPYSFEHKQPDNSSVSLRMMGDERVKWAETLDFYTVLRNSKGDWEYAALDKHGDIVTSGILAHNPSERSVKEITFLVSTKRRLSFSSQQISLIKSVWEQKQSKRTKGFNPSGDNKMLMILMDFQDWAFQRTPTDFDNLMNQVNFNSGNATGSVRDFYLENSWGQFTFTTTVVGPFTAANNMAYYGANHPTTYYDMRPDSLVSEAVRLAANSVDYSQYDNDSDGNVDGVYVVYAGYGEEAGASANAIWAHASTIPTIVRNGVNIIDYACSAELRNTSGTVITSIGIISHELGHSLGAPDFYDTDFSTNGQYNGTGYWDLMADGNWNNDGDTPAHHNVYTKYAIYGWLTPTLVTNYLDVTLRDIKDYPDAIYYNTTTSNEYFICENRQLTGFNAHCPGHGMIIYHVDSYHISNNFASNSINTGAHQGLYPMSATSTTSTGIMLSGSSNTINTGGCPWPGSVNKTQFNDATTPNSLSWLGFATNMPLNSITETTGNVHFCANACDLRNPTNLIVAPFSTKQINISWTPNTAVNPVMIAVNTVNDFGVPIDGTAYSVGNAIAGGGTVIFNGTGTNFIHTGLLPQTTYYYKAWSVTPGDIYSIGIINNGNTFYSLPFAENFDDTSIPPHWTQIDHSGNGQIWQFGRMDHYAGVYSSTPMPNLNGKFAYLNSGCYGSGNTQNVDLISPSYDFTDYSTVLLSFKFYMQVFSSSTVKLYYSIDNGLNWTLFVSWNTTSLNNPENFALFLPPFVDGKSQVKLKWNYTATWDYFYALDEVQLTGNYGPTWTGSADNNWNNPSNWLNNAVPAPNKDVVIPVSSVYPAITQSVTNPVICNNLTVDPGASVFIEPGGALTVNGILTNNNGVGGLVLKSDATGTGSLLHSTDDVQATINRYVTGSSSLNSMIYHQVSVPLTSAANPTAGIFLGAYLFYFNESAGTGGSWVSAGSSTTTSLDVDKGLLIYYPNTNNTFCFAGPMRNGTVSPPLCFTDASHGCNLIPNPYPSAIDWDASGLTLNNVDDAIYIWNSSSSTSAYGSYVNGTSTNGVTNIIPVGQSFFVHTNASSPSISISNAARLHDATAFMKKDRTFNPDELHIFATANNVTDEIAVRLYENSTVNFDSHADAYKMDGNAFNPQLCSFTPDGDALSINALPFDLTSVVVPVSFTMDNDNEVILTFSGVDSFGPTYAIFLEDLLTNEVVEIMEDGQFSFYHNQNNTPNRFNIHFLGVTSLEEGVADDYNIWNLGDKIYIDIPEEMNESAVIELFDLSGKMIDFRYLRLNKPETIQCNHKGVILIRITSEKKAYIKKLIIQ